MEKVETMSVQEVADILEFDPQTIRSQIASDMEKGTNEQNFNAFKVGNKFKIPKGWFFHKAYGRAYEVPEHVARVMERMGLVVAED